MADDRNRNGTFARGNPGGPGRPKRITEIHYAKALMDAVSIEDWRAVVVKAVLCAKAGDAKARDWLTRHIIGEPVPPSMVAAHEAFDPDGEKTITLHVAGLLDREALTDMGSLPGAMSAAGRIVEGEDADE